MDRHATQTSVRLPGSSPWQEVYEPSRKTASGIVHYGGVNGPALKPLETYKA